MTYSIDFRRKVLAIRDKENLSMAEVSKRFGVGLASIMRWSKTLGHIQVRSATRPKFL